MKEKKMRQRMSFLGKLYITFLVLVLIFHIIPLTKPYVATIWARVVIGATIAGCMFAEAAIYDDFISLVTYSAREFRRGDEKEKELLNMIIQEYEEFPFLDKESDQNYRDCLSQRDSLENRDRIEETKKQIHIYKWVRFVFYIIGVAFIVLIILFENIYNACIYMQEEITIVAFILLVVSMIFFDNEKKRINEGVTELVDSADLLQEKHQAHRKKIESISRISYKDLSDEEIQNVVDSLPEEVEVIRVRKDGKLNIISTRRGSVDVDVDTRK